jgi:hypothetical protein
MRGLNSDEHVTDENKPPKAVIIIRHPVTSNQRNYLIPGLWVASTQRLWQSINFATTQNFDDPHLDWGGYVMNPR